MNGKVLFVDDDPILLDTFRRMLGREFSVDIAVGPFEGLKAIEEKGPYGVIVSDMKMPGMDGVTFLKKAREISPDSVRMMLTGLRDVGAATGAVNEGNVFRFLTKPCQTEDLLSTIRAGFDQYRLIIAERELLEETLSGAVRMMSDILALVNPVAFGRATRIRRYVCHMAEQLHLENAWQYELAGLLSQIGCVSLTPEILNKAWAGRTMSPEEEKMFLSHPDVAFSLLSKIPRMGATAHMIALQQTPPAPKKGGRNELPPEIVMGGEMLRLALALDENLTGEESIRDAVDRLAKGKGAYVPALLDALGSLELHDQVMAQRAVTIEQLEIRMVLDEDVRASNGTLLLAKGFEVTPAMIMRLRGYAVEVGIAQPFRVLVPQSEAGRVAA